MTRLTPQRRAVLDVLRAADDHPTAHEVYARVRTESPGIGFATVYRALHALVDAELALELDLGDTAARYDANVHPHDHVVCDGCGRAVDIEPALPPSTLAAVAGATGYDVSGYSLKFRGRCAACTPTPQRGTP